jgi:hypothetical protein
MEEHLLKLQEFLIKNIFLTTLPEIRRNRTRDVTIAMLATARRQDGGITCLQTLR